MYLIKKTDEIYGDGMMISAEKYELNRKIKKC